MTNEELLEIKKTLVGVRSPFTATISKLITACESLMEENRGLEEKYKIVSSLCEDAQENVTHYKELYFVEKGKKDELQSLVDELAGQAQAYQETPDHNCLEVTLNLKTVNRLLAAASKQDRSPDVSKTIDHISNVGNMVQEKVCVTCQFMFGNRHICKSCIRGSAKEDHWQPKEGV